jgi:2-hydroxycyclohexanecarboxyl-CoA dehydrogenase
MSTPDGGSRSTGYASDLMAGRVAVITGAGGAICGETARMLAASGCSLVVTDVDEERLLTTVALAEAEGSEVAHVAGDITDPAVVLQVTALATERFGRIDVLLNGVGEHLLSAGPFEDSSEDMWQRLYEVNLLHVMRMTHAVLPYMKQQGWGRIVNFSSVEGIRAAPQLAVYAALKRAVDGFTRSLAVDVARHGVLVNAIAPDKTRAYQVGHYELPEEYARLADTWVPAGRYGEAVDVARVAVMLASPLNTWIVGETIATDGGTLAAGGWYRTPKRWTNQPLLTQYFEDPGVNAQRPGPVQ